MCGIVGCVGKEKCIPILINGLKSLEYRGYDSAGIAYNMGGAVIIEKATGKVANLENNLNSNVNSYLGIAHTRWATNGEPNEINAHPHKVGKIILVHNGIIENANEIKKNVNYNFKSQTDTEVCAYVTNKLLEENNDDMVKALTLCQETFTGSYALAIIKEDDPNTLYALKNSSPLIIGVGDHTNYVASDVPAIIKYTDKYIILDDYEMAVIRENQISVYKSGMPITKKIRKSNINLAAIKKSDYNHFMLKEIFEQSDTITNTIKKYINNGIIQKGAFPDFTKYDSIEIVGCGSAFHVGCVGKSLIEEYTDKFVKCEIASEYRYSNNVHYGKPLAIFISQSGETADTLASLKMVKESSIDTLAIVNTKESSIAREADSVIYIEAGPEIAVATTKAYTAQLSILSLITLIMANDTNNISNIEYQINEFSNIGSVIKRVLDKSLVIKEIAKDIYKEKDIFFIGRKVDYSICLEGSLKLKEISYIHSEAYPAGELKHGTISLIEQNTPVISVITDEKIASKTLSNIEETLARGSKSIIFTIFDFSNQGINYKHLVTMPKTSKFLQPIIAVIYLQLLAYYVADFNGCDIDKPKNLAKSVTVE